MVQGVSIEAIRDSNSIILLCTIFLLDTTWGLVFGQNDRAFRRQDDNENPRSAWLGK